MKVDTSDLSLFGYDLSKAFAWFRLAWRELLWDRESPLLKSFEEPVQLFDAASNSEIGIFRGDKRLVAYDKGFLTKAVCLAEDCVLLKRVRLPAAIETDISEVMQLELAANSPFLESDSVMGWRLSKREGGLLDIDLLIAHKADARQAMSVIPGADELWAKAPSGMVLMQGFREAHRHKRYLSSLKVVGLKCLVLLVLVCTVPAMVSGFRFLQMEKVQQQFQSYKRNSAEAVEARQTLAAGNELLARFNDLITEYPEPSYYLKLITMAADDSVWLRNFNLSGSKLQITGYANDATAFIQLLSQLDEFSQVRQRGGIRRDNATGSEVFTLDISLNPDFKLPGADE